MPTFRRVAFIGFGEAGPAFATHLLAEGSFVVAYDILSDDPDEAPAQRRKTEALGAELGDSAAAAARGAELVISTVTADQTVAAARSAAAGLGPGQIYLDLNSTSPARKREAAALIEASGASFVEGVAMDTVPLYGHRVPLLLAGAEASALATRLNGLDMRVEAVGGDIGRASSIKMLRSVLIKGMEALFVEAMLGAGRLGVQDRVIASLQTTLPGMDWQRLIGYHLSRVALHGRRRAAEMDAVAETLSELGVEPLMAEATARRQRGVVALDLATVYAGVESPTVAQFIDAAAAAEASR